MKDLSEILGNPTESFTAEVIWDLQNCGDLYPRIRTVARSFHDVWHIPCHEALERINAAQAAGEVMLCHRPDEHPYMAIEGELGLRITARVAYFCLEGYVGKPSTRATEILVQDGNPPMSIDSFQEAFGSHVIDRLAIDLGLSLEDAFHVICADGLTPGELAEYADTLNLYLRYREDFAA